MNKLTYCEAHGVNLVQNERCMLCERGVEPAELIEVLRTIVHEYDQTYDAESDGGSWRGSASIPVHVMERAKLLVT